MDEFELASDFRREVYVCFVGTGRYVFFEEQGGIGILNLFSKRTGSLSILGELIGMGESEDPGILSVLSGNGQQKELLLCDYTGALLHREVFECLD